MKLSRKFFISGIALLVLLTSFWYFFIYNPEPRGYALLRYAEEAIQNQEYEQANFTLQEVSHWDFAPDGNSMFESIYIIDSMRIENLYNLEDYAQIRHQISAPGYSGNHDYHLIKSLFLELGEDSVFSCFQKGLKYLRFERERIDSRFSSFQNSGVVYAFVPLIELNLTMKLHATQFYEPSIKDQYAAREKRVKEFMSLSFEEQKEKLKQNWQYKVLTGQEKLKRTSD